MAGTIEEKIYHRQIFKQFLTNRVLKDPKQQRFFKTNDLYELFSLSEGEKEKTESSAIFAGTGSEIKLGVKKQNEQSRKRNFDTQENRGPGNNVEVSSVPEDRLFSDNAQKHKTQNKSHESKISKSIAAFPDENVGKTSAQIGLSQVEKMKELAKLISKKIGSTKKPQGESTHPTHSDSSHIGENLINTESLSTTPLKDDVKVKIGENKADVNMVKEEPGKLVLGNLATNKSSAEENIVDREMVGKTETTGTEEMTAVGESLSFENVSGLQEQGKRDTNLATGSKCLEKAEEKSVASESILFKALSVKDSEGERKQDQKVQHGMLEVNSDLNTEQIKHRSKHKKNYRDGSQERHKEHYKKGRKFEGKRIEYLVKKRKYQKTEEEEKEEKDLSKSQDQYVLEKLFRKSGIHGALSHDVIMNNSDPDYLLVEGEAERVAKEALKAVRASRARCFRPPPIDHKTRSPGKSTLKFGKKKSQIFNEVSSARCNKTKDGSHKEKKIPMFSGGFQEETDEEDKVRIDNDVKEGDGSKLGIPQSNAQGVGTSGMLSSSQLLSRMHQRNKGIALDSEDDEEEDYDPDYPSTAAVEHESLEPEVQENIDLLTDIRNFVAFQAEVDGQATTQEIISRFQQRLPASQTPFFKALLTKICDFHRDNNGKGIWSLKEEFR